MSVRFKLLGVAVVLLGLFSATLMLSSSMVDGVNRAIGGIVAYHIPLTALVSELDVLTDEYELNLRRVLGSSADLPAVTRRQAAIVDRIHAIFKESDKILERAERDEANDVSDRLILASVGGAFAPLARKGPEFLALGERVLNAITEKRIADAQEELGQFSAYYELFGPDIANIRRKVSNLSDSSLRKTATQSAHVMLVNRVLFWIAAGLGLGVFAIFGYELHRGLHRLIEGARQVKNGELTVELPVTSRDEIGQLSAAFNGMAAELRSKERIRDTFGKFVDPRIVATLLGDQTVSSALAERRPVTIFFSDIRRFTSISEQLAANTIVDLLNAYFTSMTGIVRARNGIVDKYIGDAVMAFWTRPFSAGDRHAAEACLAALEQQEALIGFRTRLPDIVGLRRNAPDFQVRIGLATGDAVVGTIGSDTVRSYTVIGDTVNVAARMESANKVYRTSILASEETVGLAGATIESREIDLLIVAGKTEPIRVFEVLCLGGHLAAPMAELRGSFAEALLAYRKLEWDAAELKFQECLRLCPHDGPSQAFLARIPAMRLSPPPQSWGGVWDATCSGPWIPAA
jgi:adenylate cyclase